MSEIRSKPQTKDFDDGYDRTFGRDRKPVRGKWVVRNGQLIDARDAPPPEEHAKDAPVMVDLWMSGTVSPVDGSDIGSRAKLAEHNKRHGLIMARDFEQTWAKGEAERERKTKDVSYDDRTEAKRTEDRKRLYHRMAELERNPRRR